MDFGNTVPAPGPRSPVLPFSRSPVLWSSRPRCLTFGAQ